MSSSEGKKLYVGNEIFHRTDLIRHTMFSPFEGNVPIRMDAQEFVIDHALQHLGLDGQQGGVPNPFFITEPVAMPRHARCLLAELLFECYRAPALCTGVDALCSHYYNSPGRSEPASALIISSSFSKTHVLPVLDGRLASAAALRMSLGGFHLESFLLGLLQLKHPLLALSIANVQGLIRDHAYVARDYAAELAELADPAAAAAVQHVIQLPFARKTRVVLSEEEKAARHAELVERGKRLAAAARQQRLDRLAAAEARVALLASLLASQEDMTKAQHRKLLAASGFDTAQDVQAEIDALSVKISQQRARLGEGGGGAGGAPESGRTEPVPAPLNEEQMQAQERELFPLLFVADDALSAEQVAERARQRSQAAMRRGRETQRVRRLQERAEQAAAAAAAEAERLADPERWLAQLRAERDALVARKAERERLKEQLHDRHSTASKKRMAMLARHAQGDMEADFGTDDAHWAVYRELAGDVAGESDDEAQTRLDELEALLSQHDPRQREPVQRDEAVDFQLSLCVERIRVPELLFQPSIIGLRQCGLLETTQLVLRKFAPAQRERLVADVFCTGSVAAIPHLAERLSADLRSILPFESPFAVRLAADPTNDAWRGAALWARQPGFAATAVSRAEYDEHGAHYMKEHALSNRRE